MRLLVSVLDVVEALQAVDGGAHIVDAKNPREGSLGANFPGVIKQIRGAIPNRVEVSATIGDLPNLPGTASLAALGAASSGAQYVKAGLFGVRTVAESLNLVKEICKAVKEYDEEVKVIAAGYADYEEIRSVNPLDLPAVAYRAGADGVMVDIKLKGRGGLFDLMSDKELKEFVGRAHERRLIAALAGSLHHQEVGRVHQLGADVIGVRKAVCVHDDRSKPGISKTAVSLFIDSMKTCGAGGYDITRV